MLALESGLCIATFYNHFTDKDALLLWIHQLGHDAIMESLRKGQIGPADILPSYISYYTENATFMKNALHHTTGEDWYGKMCADYSIQSWEEYLLETHHLAELPEAVRFALEFFWNAFFLMLVKFLNHEWDITEEAFAAQIEACVPSELRVFIDETGYDAASK